MSEDGPMSIFGNIPKESPAGEVHKRQDNDFPIPDFLSPKGF